MENVYFYCSVIGGAVLILQVLMMLISGGEGEFDTDASPEAGVGDIVEITQTRPMSKLKRWRLLRIVQKASV